jgi:hypothetical protein
MSGGGDILRRIDAALEKCAFRKWEVRAIYLTDEDHDAFDRAMRRRFKVKASFLAYGPYQIRRGNASKIYCAYSGEIVVPKALSPRVREAA